MLAAGGLRRPGNSDSVLERLHELGRWALVVGVGNDIDIREVRADTTGGTGRRRSASRIFSPVSTALVHAKSIWMTWRQDVTIST